jgi:hypothetical protein
MFASSHNLDSGMDTNSDAGMPAIMRMASPDIGKKISTTFDTPGFADALGKRIQNDYFPHSWD